MTHLCQHCATPYIEGSGVDGFCCAGCQQVYLLIQNEGLEDFYRKQDRAAQPLKDRALAEVDAVALRAAQLEVEQAGATAQAVFNVEGMSCMGCAWLIERLCANQTGLIKSEASLSTYSLRLEWRSADFDLASLGSELLKFGYRLDAKPRSPRETARLSPLTLRFLLTTVFAGNALLLAAYQQFVAPGEGSGGMVDLLSLVCLFFTLMLGAAPFFMSVYRASQIRRWHSDWFAVALIVAVGVYVLRYGVSVGGALVALLVWVLIGARCLAARLSHR